MAAVLQNFIDLASEITVDTRPTTGSVMTRSGIARAEQSVNRLPWKFSVRIPPQPWYLMRGYLTGLTASAQTVPETVRIGNTPQTQWLFRWQGGPLFGNPVAQVLLFTGTQMTITTLNTALNGLYAYRAGDIIQITGLNYPFMVVDDVYQPPGSTVTSTLTLNLHRPNMFTANQATKVVLTGDSCRFYLYCPRVPAYIIKQGARQYGGYQESRLINDGYVEFLEPLELVEWLGDVV